MTFITNRFSGLASGYAPLAQAAPAAAGTAREAAADALGTPPAARPAAAPTVPSGSIEVFGPLQPSSWVVLQVREGAGFAFKPLPSRRDELDQIIRVRYSTAGGTVQVMNLAGQIDQVSADGKQLKFWMPDLPDATEATTITIEVIDSGPAAKAALLDAVADDSPCIAEPYRCLATLLASVDARITPPAVVASRPPPPPPAGTRPPAVVVAAPPPPPAPREAVAAGDDDEFFDLMGPTEEPPAAPVPAAEAAATPASSTAAAPSRPWYWPDRARFFGGLGREKVERTAIPRKDPNHPEELKGKSESYFAGASLQWRRIEVRAGGGAAQVHARDAQNPQSHFDGTLYGAEAGVTGYVFDEGHIWGPLYFNPFVDLSAALYRGVVENVKPATLGGLAALGQNQTPDLVRATVVRPAVGLGARLSLRLPEDWAVVGGSGLFARVTGSHTLDMDKFWIKQREEISGPNGRMFWQANAGFEFPIPALSAPEPVAKPPPPPPAARAIPPFQISTNRTDGRVSPAGAIKAEGGRLGTDLSQLSTVRIGKIDSDGVHEYAVISLDPGQPGKGFYTPVAEPSRRVEIAVTRATFTTPPSVIVGMPLVETGGSPNFPGLETGDQLHFQFMSAYSLMNEGTVTFEKPAPTAPPPPPAPPSPPPEPEMSAETGPYRVPGDGGSITIRGAHFTGTASDYELVLLYPANVRYPEIEVPLRDVAVTSETTITAVVPAILADRTMGIYTVTIRKGTKTVLADVQYTSDRAAAPQTILIINEGGTRKIAGFSEANFNKGSATLTSSSQRNFDQSADWVIGAIMDGTLGPADRIVIKGFTDSSGLDTNNLKLSFKRADAVRQYKIGACRRAVDRFTPALSRDEKRALKARISGSLFVAEGYGEYRRYILPDAASEDPDSSRRVEYEVRAAGTEIPEGAIQRIDGRPRVESPPPPPPAPAPVAAPPAAAPAEPAPPPIEPAAAPPPAGAPPSAAGVLDAGSPAGTALPDARPSPPPPAGRPDAGSEVKYE